MVSLFLLPSFLSLHRALPISLLLSLSLSVSRRGLSRAQPAVKLKNFRAFCGPPDESPGVHADWLDYRLGFETHQTDRKICRLHNSARLIRTCARVCVRAYAYARRDTGTYTRSTHVHTSVHASRARARAEYTYAASYSSARCIYQLRKLCPSIESERYTPLSLLSFFLSFFLSSFLSFFLPFPPRPCSIFYEAPLPPFGNAISRKPPPDFPRLSLFLFSRFLFQRF